MTILKDDDILNLFDENFENKENLKKSHIKSG